MSERGRAITPILLKVGGSLFDLPDLAARLRMVLAGVNHHAIFLFPGGGPTADVVRDLDRRHGLGAEAAHWLALRALTLNAHFLHELLPELSVAVWPNFGERGIVEPYGLARADEANPGQLPHRWEVTSDSLAVRAAAILGARQLILLKSMTMPSGMTWAAAQRSEIVDAFFSTALEKAPNLDVSVVNLRELSTNGATSQSPGQSSGDRIVSVFLPERGDIEAYKVVPPRWGLFE